MKRLVVLAALLVTCACATTSGATTRPSLLMHVSVKLTSSSIVLSRSLAYRGDEVEFAVRNRTRSKRIFSVAGKAIVVPANKLRLTAISFQARGRYRVISRTRSSRVTAVFRVQ